MRVASSILLHFIGGFVSGNFHIPFWRIERWSWDSCWLIGKSYPWVIVATPVAIPAIASSFIQFLFYPMGECKLDKGANSWTLPIDFVVLITNSWGTALTEWRGVDPATPISNVFGITTIPDSVALIGIGKSLS